MMMMMMVIPDIIFGADINNNATAVSGHIHTHKRKY